MYVTILWLVFAYRFVRLHFTKNKTSLCICISTHSFYTLLLCKTSNSCNDFEFMHTTSRKAWWVCLGQGSSIPRALISRPGLYFLKGPFFQWGVIMAAMVSESLNFVLFLHFNYLQFVHFCYKCLWIKSIHYWLSLFILNSLILQ